MAFLERPCTAWSVGFSIRKNPLVVEHGCRTRWWRIVNAVDSCQLQSSDLLVTSALSTRKGPRNPDCTKVIATSGTSIVGNRVIGSVKKGLNSDNRQHVNARMVAMGLRMAQAVKFMSNSLTRWIAAEHGRCRFLPGHHPVRRRARMRRPLRQSEIAAE